MSVVIGVDAGGTGTTVLVADGDGRSLARGEFGPGVVRPGHVSEAAHTIADAIGVMRAKVSDQSLRAVVVGAAGVGREAERTALRAALAAALEPVRLDVITDGEIALYAAHEHAAGTVMIVGTGAAGFGRGRDGSIHRVGGYGGAFADEPGGYNIGRAALAAIGRAHDGRGPATALTAAARVATGTERFEELVRWAGAADYAGVASLARCVLAAARDGDEPAETIVDEAAHVLLGLIERLADLCGVVPLALAGGLVGEDSVLRHRLVQRIGERRPQIPVMPGTVDPAAGAVGLARNLA